ncbi:hypothetical protein [Photobacterium swingsii]|uniref:hypothetical protein n=1 Tax=Photobacterium swingsii TaxID=680026 RepID=UPI0040689C0C
MAKHLTDKDIKNVVELLDDWPTDARLTWDALVEAVEHDHRLKTTRQTLSKQPRIKAAFGEVKKIVSGNTGKANSAERLKPPSLKVAAERLETKDRTIKRLEAENARLLEQFHRWIYNAHLHGVTPAQLDQPLPTKDD